MVIFHSHLIHLFYSLLVATLIAKKGNHEEVGRLELAMVEESAQNAEKESWGKSGDPTL